MKLLRNLVTLSTALALWLASPAHGVIEGRVLNSQGVAVEGAQIVAQTAEGVTLTAATDSRGRFTLDVESMATLEVLHPRYERVQKEVDGASAEPVVLELLPKQALYEEIVVSASRSEGDAPVSIAATAIEPEELPTPVSTLGELVSSVSGVSENGQGGIFQAYSIRGISRQRIQSMIDGVRIVSERRAGVSVSFVDPELLETVHVLRGPTSSYYGSGALGGVIQLLPRRYDSLRVGLGYETQGDAHHQSVGWGDDRWSLAATRRQADNAEAPNGQELNTGFRQYNLLVGHDWTVGSLGYRLQAIGTRGSDIRKANVDFPEEVATYPEEEHLLLRFSLQRGADFQAGAWVHPNELTTRVIDTTTGDRAEVFNEAFDFGAHWQTEFAALERLSARVGVDWFGRRGVTAEEVDTPGGGGGSSVQATLNEGEEDEAGVYGAAEWSLGRATALVGGRYAWQRQANDGGPSSDDQAWSGFVGLVAPLGSGFELAANVGTGLRFPSLSERFFTGATGRGQVLGNPDLDSERSLAFDLGLRYYGRQLFATASLFRTEIDRYIERVNVTPELRTFVNLTEGTLEGAEVNAQWQLAPEWSLSFGAHAIDGEARGGQALADVPADRLHGGFAWSGERWGVDGRWEHRFDKTDPGSGEKAIGSVDRVSFAVAFAWREEVSLRLSGSNLLDEEYFNSADEDVPLAVGRSLGFSIRFEP